MGAQAFCFHYPNFKVDEKFLLAWEMMLGDLTEEQFRKAIHKFCLSHKDIYPGTNVIAYLREYALVNEEEYPDPFEAWKMVTDEIRRVGDNTPSFKNPLVQKAVEFVGWRDINFSENPEWIKSQFTKAYEQLVARQKQNTLLGN